MNPRTSPDSTGSSAPEHALTGSPRIATASPIHRGLASAILAFAAISMILVLVVAFQMTRSLSVVSESFEWGLATLQREHLKLLYEARDFDPRSGNADTTAEHLRLQYDILVSRAKILEESSELGRLQELRTMRALLDDLGRSTAEVDRRLQRASSAEEVVKTLVSGLEGFLEPIHRAAVEGTQYAQHLRLEQQAAITDRALWLIYPLIASIALMLGSFLMAAILAGRGNADLRRKNDELVLYYHTLDAAPVGILVVESSARFDLIEINTQAEAIFGIEREAYLGLPFGQLLGQLSAADDGNIERLNRAIESMLAYHDEFQCTTSYDSTIWIRVGVAPVRGTGDSAGHVVVTLEDITGQKSAQLQLIQASKLATLGEMSTSVAHELNQPLAIIRMASGNLRRKLSRGDFDAEELLDKLVKIEAQTARAASIIDHMRMFGREPSESFTPIDVRQAIRDALGLVGEQLRLSEIELATDFPEHCPAVLAHPIQFEQVILNIVTNAIHVIAESGVPGRIRVSVKTDRSRVNVTIDDNGGGIPEKSLPRLFDPFFTTKDPGKGTGLGLAVSYGIVRDMRGTITATNTEAGARFTVSVPIADDAEEPTGDHHGPPPPTEQPNHTEGTVT